MSSALQLKLPGLTCDLGPLFRAAHLALKPRTPVPDIRVELFPFAGVNHTARLNNGKLLVRVSDIFEQAPEHVLQCLALILLGKLYRKKVADVYHQIYRGFILSQDIQERARIARTTRGRSQKRFGTQGRHIDLEASFDRLNREYFSGQLDRPQISWSRTRSRYVLGRYDMHHHTIFISRLFDSPKVPTFVVDYVMFHEMLHVKHKSRIEDCRVRVHTPEFRTDEQTFVHYKEAKAWLRQI